MKMTLNLRGQLVSYTQPIVMGILNVTPDSFYDGGRYCKADEISRRVDQIISEGAEIIDIGAYSSRPGAQNVTVEEEWSRLSQGLEIIHKRCPEAIISVDTFRADVAEKSIVDGGAAIINDISAGMIDVQMFPTVAKLGVPYILMHMQGTPQDMQNQPQYNDVTNEVILFLSEKVLKLRQLGVKDIIIDPGFGFGKTIEHNYTLLRNLDKFKIFDMPLLVGISRKSMIYKPLNITPQEALNGTTVLNTLALVNGASILRVHDVKAAVESIKLMKYYTDTQ